ncbi:glycosyl transferase family 4 [Candidatus Parvarchaeota archaeon]|nr:MAG: glycosyl transferase family 4 [Candidatus Parvarchaeota archaeon]PXY71519.1 MAG: glycosyl transferase family 4 [Candidatus Parvarchaeota archaeon]
MISNLYIFVPLIISFLGTLLILPLWIRKAKQIGLVWNDMNKIGFQKVAGSGGVIVSLSFVIGIFIFIAYKVFWTLDSSFLIEILALVVVILILTIIGLIDDLFGWQKGGLSKKSRILFVFLASIPLIVINAGKSEISIPLIGLLDIGIFYPLLAIPIGIIGAATTFNFLAGFNGLEAGQGIILLSALSLVSFFTGTFWLGIISLCMVFSLLAFLIYNFFPAKIFPGDSLTYTIGGLIAIISILGNFEKIAIFFFIPIILETILKARGRLQKQSFGKLSQNGTLDLKYDKIYSLTHLAIFILNKNKKRATEKKVVFLIWAFQILIVLTGFLIFRKGIFM